jgi:menaquinol-cytochrome c reductase iron-sulfur subunit
MESQSRRKFLARLTGIVVAAGGAVTTWPLLRSLVPNVLYEPPKRFKVGAPDRIQQGVTYVDKHRLYLFREGNGLFVISGICTHLGCTLKFSPYKKKQEQTVRGHTFESEGEFHCPCHGSKFYGEGTNFAGPAPRPLKWHPLEVSPEDGELVVDVGGEVERDFRLVV